eukprot:COSAG05_NODE_2239_length_3353_cov_423.015980_9_plen_85_part_00
MDSLHEIYIEDLATGSRSKNSSIEEFFVPAQRHPLGSTEYSIFLLPKVQLYSLICTVRCPVCDQYHTGNLFSFKLILLKHTRVL